MGRRRVDWSLEMPAGAGRINWEFDGEKISRKSTVQRSFDQREANIQASVPANANEYVVNIHIEGSRVLITGENGTVLDDYTPTNPTLRDLTTARIGIRTSANSDSLPEDVMRSAIDLPGNAVLAEEEFSGARKLDRLALLYEGIFAAICRFIRAARVFRIETSQPHEAAWPRRCDGGKTRLSRRMCRQHICGGGLSR
jgi:hypothetical protein